MSEQDRQKLPSVGATTFTLRLSDPTTLRSPFLIPRLVRHPAHCLGCISFEPTTTFCSAGFLILAKSAHLSRQPTRSLTIITFWTPSRQSTPYIAISLPLLAEGPSLEPPKKYIHIFGPYILGSFSSSCYKTRSVTLFSLPPLSSPLLPISGFIYIYSFHG